MRKAGKWLALVLAVVLVFSLVGCGGSKTSGTGSDKETGGEATGKAETPELNLVAAGTLTIGSDTAFPPFESMKGSTPEGFDVDLAKAIAEELKVKLDFRSEKFDTLIPTLKAGGKFDAIMSAMTITDARKQEIDFSDPYIDSNQSIAVMKTSAFKSQADLAGKNIGVQSGTTGQQWANENLKTKGAKIVPFDDVMAAFAALQSGKVDAVVNDLPVSAYVVKDPARNMKLIEEIPTGEQYGIGISKSNPELLKAVNDALKKIKESGKYAEIYKTWFGVEPSSIP